MLRCHGIGVKDRTFISVLPTQVHFESPPEQCCKALDPKTLPQDLKEDQSFQVWLLDNSHIPNTSEFEKKNQGDYRQVQLCGSISNNLNCKKTQKSKLATVTAFSQKDVTLAWSESESTSDGSTNQKSSSYQPFALKKLLPVYHRTNFYNTIKSRLLVDEV